MKIPFTNIGLQDGSIRQELKNNINTVIDSNNYILGNQVDLFEQNLSQYLNSKYCISVANGTEAIELSLLAGGINKGDKVIVPVNTFIATALAVHRIGAIPVFIDCDPDYYLLDVSKLEIKDAKAIIPVDLYGQIAPFLSLKEIVGDKLLIIEDAAQSIGASFDNTSIGSNSDLTTISFYPTKNLGAYGDGGAIVTNNASFFTKLKALRNYGSTEKYYHETIGYNSRLDELQAIILNTKLLHLTKWNNQRISIAKNYDLLLRDTVCIPKILPGNKHVYHLYVIQVPDKRDECINFLQSKGIDVKIHYPIPLHLQPAFSFLQYKKGDFPNAEKIASNMFSLPMFPDLTLLEQEYIANCIKEFYEK